ncbi:MAG: hypothetical protein KGV50_02890 [Gammaproteobacteria bacterium]|nr:hypothetical protein [Gammaproteobacteria bacterium]
MIVATLITYFCFFYFYLYKNDQQTLTHIITTRLPVALAICKHFASPWAMLLISFLPWWYLQGLEVGIAAWLVSLSLVALPIILLYPHVAKSLLAWSKKLLIIGIVLFVLGEFGAAYVK